MTNTDRRAAILAEIAEHRERNRRRSAPRFLVEITDRDGFLLRRQRFTKRSLAEAVEAFRELWKYAERTTPGTPTAAEFYRTSGEPFAPAEYTIRFYQPPRD